MTARWDVQAAALNAFSGTVAGNDGPSAAAAGGSWQLRKELTVAEVPPTGVAVKDETKL